jgi:opacity protein-like surface antigen
MRKSIFLISVAAASLWAVAAPAADLYEAPAGPAAPAPALEPWNGMYVSLHGGVVWLSDVVADLYPDDVATFEIQPGFRVGGSVGYDFGPNFGIEAEASYAAFNPDFVTVYDTGGSFEGDGPVTGSASALTLMGNLIVGTQMGSVRPYIGVGGGGALVSANVDLFSGVNDSAWTWAAQAFAGLDLALTRNVSIGARYRFQWIGPSTMSDGDGDPVNIRGYGIQGVEGVLKIRFGN